MPYKDRTKQAAQQRDKWTLWREMQDGFADGSSCANCELPIFALNEERFSQSEQRWYHFIDPVGLGFRPLGKNDPVYDLVRRCDIAVKHRWIPEAFEDHDGNFQGLDPRVSRYQECVNFANQRLSSLTTKDIATPLSSKAEGSCVRVPAMTTHTTTYIDPRQEAALLDRYGLSYTERVVSLAEIDFDRSKQLNGRSETRANPDKIMEYAVKKLDGEVFPYPVIAFDRSLGKYLVWSGIHRIGADIEVKASSTRCFVVNVPTETAAVALAKLKQFSHEANVRHGFATSAAERISAACDELEIGGDIDAIALRFSLRPEEITKGLHLRKVDFNLRQCNIRPEHILRISDKEALLRLPDEHVMRDVANFLKRHTTRDPNTGKQRVRVSQGDLNSLVSALKKEKSPAARTDLIANADKEAKRAKPKAAPRGKRTLSNHPLFIWKGIVARVVDPNFNEHQLVETASTPDERDAIITDVKQIRAVIDAVERAVERQG